MFSCVSSMFSNCGSEKSRNVSEFADRLILKELRYMQNKSVFFLVVFCFNQISESKTRVILSWFETNELIIYINAKKYSLFRNHRTYCKVEITSEAPEEIVEKTEDVICLEFPLTIIRINIMFIQVTFDDFESVSSQ